MWPKETIFYDVRNHTQMDKILHAKCKGASACLDCWHSFLAEQPKLKGDIQPQNVIYACLSIAPNFKGTGNEEVKKWLECV